MSSPGSGSDAVRPCSSVSQDVLCCSSVFLDLVSSPWLWTKVLPLVLLYPTCASFYEHLATFSHSCLGFHTLPRCGTLVSFGVISEGFGSPGTLLFLHSEFNLCSCGAAHQGLGEFSSEERPLPTSHSRLSLFLLRMNFQDIKESLHLHGSKWEMCVK